MKRRLREAVLQSLEDRLLLSSNLPTPYIMPQVFLTQPSGYLAGPSAGTPLDVALGYLCAHAEMFGVAAAEVGTPVVTDEYADADSGITHLYLRQTYNNLEIANANVNFNIAADGRILSAGGAFTHLPSNYSPLATGLGGVAVLSASNALVLAGQALGLNSAGPITDATVAGLPSDSLQLTNKNLSLDPIPATQSYLVTESGIQRVWDFVLRTPDSQHWYDTSVDAYSGALLATVDWVDHASYNVFPIPVESPLDGSRSVVTNPADPTASPYGWHDTNGVAGAEYTDTRGNNVFAQEDTDHNDSGGFRPDGTASLNFNFALDLTQAPSAYQSAAITNLFYWDNILHDIHFNYGFDEASGNFQVKNYSSAGLGNDAVQADAQDGSGTNNANFATPPDGSAPRMQMYVFTSTSPARDGDLENTIITHEYGHGVSNRLTGGPSNANALNALQSGGMGEGWSDWWSLMLTMKPTDTKTGSYPVGNWVIGENTSGGGIRRYPYSFDMAVDPLTVGNFNTSNEVHDVGEIWCSALWDMAWLLIDKHGFSADYAHGYNASDAARNGGNNLALKLVMDALKLQPANPSFAQARDAIIQADQVLTGGDNAFQIWTAFARRGMGLSFVDSSSSAPSVTPATDIPLGLAGPAVVSQTPSGVSTSPVSSLDLTFSEPMNPASFDVASDVNSFTGPGGVNLKPAITGGTWTNSNKTLHLSFSTQNSNGLYSLSIGPQILGAADGKAMDQNNNGILAEAGDAYVAQSRYDALIGAVISTVPANGTIVTLPLSSIDFTFNEAFAPASLSAGDLAVNQGTVTGVTAVNATTARFSLSGLNADSTLTFSIAAGAVTDVDGNPMAAYSGSLILDVATAAFPTPLTPLSPLGSLVYASTVSGVITPAGDTDTFTLTVDPGQTITVLVTPTSTSLRPGVQLLNPASTAIGTATAAAAGQNALLQSISTTGTTAGTYSFVVSGAAGTTGAYTLQITLNAAIEAEGRIAGAADNSLATAQNIDGSFVPLSSAPPTANRGAVLGQHDGFTAYSASAATYAFENIASTGAVVSFANTDDGSTSVPIGFDFLFYGSLYRSLYVDTNGLLSFGVADSSFSNSDLTTSPAEAVIAPFWDDLIVGGAADSKVVYQLLGSGPSTHLVIQWNNVSFYADSPQSGGITYEAVLNLDGSIRFNYQSLADSRNGGTHDRGISATVGVKDAGAQGTNRLLLCYNNGPTGLVNSGTSIFFAAPNALASDYYSFSVSAGDTGSFVLTNLSAAPGKLELLDASAALLASGIAAATSVTTAISNFTFATAGTYYVRVYGATAASYSLVTTRNAVFATDPNSNTTQAQRIGSNNSMLGYIGQSTASVEPDDYVAGTALTSVVPGITLSAQGDTTAVTSQAGAYSSTGTRVFAHGTNTEWYSGGCWLRADIAGSASSISIDILPNDASDPGIMRAYNAAGALLQEVTCASPPLGSFTTLTITRPTADIAYVLVAGLDGDTALLDHLVVSGIGAGVDVYAVNLVAGVTATFATSTPADRSGEFVNTLNPRLRLLSSAGSVLATDDNSAADGRNALLSYTPSASGTYYIEVSSTTTTATTGEYVLSLAGTSPVPAPMTVATLTPANGAALAVAPTQAILTFSNPILLTSLQASDLRLDGTPLASYSLIDGHTVIFAFPAGLSNGTHTLTISSGSILDTNAGSVAAFSSTFTVDTVAPRIINSSVQAGDVRSAGTQTFSFTFNEAMSAANLDVSDFTLQGNILGGTYSPTSFSYAAGNTVLNIAYSNLPDEQYTLTLLSGDGRFEDPTGNDLDGEPHFPVPPNSSGDGIAGGNFAVSFTVENTITAFPTPLVAQGPAGSLIYSGSASGLIDTSSDTDDFTISLDAGQTVTIIMHPLSATLRSVISMHGPGGSVLGSATAPAANQDAVLQSVPVTTTGTYTLAAGASATMGMYSLQVLLNAQAESESHGGSANNTQATAQNIDASFISLGGGASRGAVCGSADLAASTLPAEVEPNDTSATANNAAANFAAAPANLFHMGLKASMSSSSDLDWFNVGVLDAGDVITISESGTPSSRGTLGDSLVYLYRANNGNPIAVANNDDGGPDTDSLIYRYTITAADTYYVVGGAYTGSGTYDLGVWLENSGAAPSTGGSVGTETEPNDTTATANNASQSWRAVQYRAETTGSITSGNTDYYQYAFTAGDLVSLDIRSTSTLDARVTLLDGTGATLALEDGTSVGPSLDSPLYGFRIPSTGTYYVMVQAASGAGTYTSDIYLSSTTPPPAPANGLDYYSFTATAGDTDSFVLTNLAAGTGVIDLLNASGAILASSLSVATNLTAAISNFSFTAPGSYYLRVSGAGSAPYSLLATRNAAFDTEPNATRPTAQPLAGNTVAVLGYASGSRPPVLSADFTSSANGFAVDNTGGGLWHLSAGHGAESGHSAQQSFYYGKSEGPTGGGTYSTGARNTGTITSPTLTLPLGTPMSVTFNYILQTEGRTSYDIASLQLKDGTGTWTTLATYNGIAEHSTWLAAAPVCLAAYAGQSVQLRFFFDTLDGVDNAYEGWYVDDVLVGPGTGIPSADEDYYTIQATAGQVITPRTLIPPDGSRASLNTFDPALDLYSPNGTLVASDDNGAGDGRNAAISYVAPLAGAYTIRVHGAPSSTGSGEYILALTLPPVTNPTAAFDAAAPNPRTTPVDTVALHFSEPVNGFDASDLMLKRNGTLLSLAGATLASSNNKDWMLGNLSGATFVAGSYVLTLVAGGAGITSQAGVPLVQDAVTNFTVTTSTIPGTTVNDDFVLHVVGANVEVSRRSAGGGTTLFSAPLSSLTTLAFDGGTGDDTLTTDFANAALCSLGGISFDGGNGSDALTIIGTTSAQSVQVLPGQVLVGTMAMACTNAEVVALDAPSGSVVEVGALTVGANLALPAGRSLTLRTGVLSITGAGMLDLAGNAMILDYAGSSPIYAVNHWLANGRRGLTPGLMTSGGAQFGTPVLGMVDNALVHLASFAGQPLGSVFSQLLITSTVAGDTNLDGVVDSSDYLAVIANMGRANSQWFMGDLNCDGIVSADDVAEVTSHLSNSTAGPSPLQLAGPVAAKTQATKVAPKPVIKAKARRHSQPARVKTTK